MTAKLPYPLKRSEVARKVPAKKAAKYTADNIKTLVFPDSVRHNASQYIGGTDAYGLWLVVRELLDNGLDEALAGRNTAVLLHLDKDGSYWVQDAGHGIPQGITKTKIHVNGKDIINKMPTMQAAFGALHTSGKYDTKAYEVSIGTHGIGAKGTNATSEYFDVWTCYEKQWSHIGFKKGVITSPVAKCKAPKGPDGKLATKGTVIHFKPDTSIFTTDKFPGQMALEWAEIMAYFNPGVAILISTPKGKRQFVSKLGVVEYVHKRLENFGVGAEKVMFEYKSEHGDPNAADIVVAFSGYTDCDMRGFTNGLNNSKGGKHVDSVIAALYEGIKPFIKTRKAREKGKVKEVPAFGPSDLKEGLVGLVNAKLHKAKFNSQDKVFLSDERMGIDLRKKLIPVAVKFFKDNKAMSQRICEKAGRIAELKTKFTLSKAAASKLNAVKRGGLPGKYAGFDNRTKISDRELFIVEGDSAGGTAKEARFPYQAILPLKGKIKNALKDAKGKATESDEIINILAALGFDLKVSDPYTKLVVGKLIILADPDPDGFHINCLVLALIYKHLPKLFDMGLVYVADSPEFYAIYKGSLVTGMHLSEVQTKLKKLKAPGNVLINHVKGWGELDSNLMRIMAMNPQTRRLIQIEPIEDADRVDFVRLMNEDVQYRRKVFGLPMNATGSIEDDEDTKTRRKHKVPAKNLAAKKVPAKKVPRKMAARKIPVKKTAFKPTGKVTRRNATV